MTQRILSGGSAAQTIEHGRDPLYLGIFAIVALLIGLFTRIALRKVPIPYTLLCLVLGILLGELSRLVHLGALSYSIDQWLALDPHTILFMFLPPLIFESASSLDFYIFYQTIYQSLLLAIPGVLISAFLTCAIAMYVLPHSWDFSTSMTLGSILAATDPVAVVALLKELGAPKRLSIVIEGESLLNDGIAFVLFQFFQKELQGESQSVGDFFSSFFYMSLVGFFGGWIIGRICVQIMGIVFSDNVAEVMLSLIGSLGAFYIIEGLVKASGVLGVLGFGVAFSQFKLGNISSEASETLEHTWETIGYVANTLVFVYSGVIINAFAFHTDSVQANDFGYLIILYLLLQGVRGLSILVLSPCLAHMGFGFHWKEGIVFTWAGLRGAVGLTLGLFVINDLQIDKRTRSLIMFYVAGIAFLTLLINGTTAGFVVKFFKIDRSSAAAKIFYMNAIYRLNEYMTESISVSRRKRCYNGVDWTQVWQRMPILSHEMQEFVENHTGKALCTKQSSRTKKLLKGIDAQFAEATPDEVERTLFSDARNRFLNLIKAAYYEEFENGGLESRPAFQILIDASTAAQVDESAEMPEWSRIQKAIHLGWWSRLLPRLHLHYLSDTLVEWRLALGYELAYVFLTVHNSVETEFKELIGNDVIAELVLSESHRQMRAAQDYLDELNTVFIDITSSVKTHLASQWILREVWVFTKNLHSSGEIEDKELNCIVKGLESCQRSIFWQSMGMNRSFDRSKVLRNCVLFEGLLPNEIDDVVSATKLQEFLPQELLETESQPSKGIFVLTNGKVKMSKSGSDIRVLTSGDIIGDIAMTTNCINECSFESETNVLGYRLKTSLIKKLLMANDRFRTNLYVHSGITILQSGLMKNLGYIMEAEHVHTIMKEAELLNPGNDEIITKVGEGGLGVLFTGKATLRNYNVIGLNMQNNAENDDSIEEEEEIESVSHFFFNGSFQFNMDAVVLYIPPHASWIIPKAEISYEGDTLPQYSICPPTSTPRGTPRTLSSTRINSSRNTRTRNARSTRGSRHSSTRYESDGVNKAAHYTKKESTPRMKRRRSMSQSYSPLFLNRVPDLQLSSNKRLQRNSLQQEQLESWNQNGDETIQILPSPLRTPRAFARSSWYGSLKSPM